MSRTFIQDGETITITAASAVKSGDGVVVGTFFGIAQTDAAAGAAVEIMLEGVHELAKVSGVAMTPGQKVYWNIANKNVVGSAGSGIASIGRVTESAGSTAATVRVLLDECASVVG